LTSVARDGPGGVRGEVPGYVLAPAVGEASPQRFIFVQSDDRFGECRSGVGNQHIASGLEVHAFDGERRCDDGKTGGVRRVYLALHARPKAQWCDREPATVHVGLQIGHVPEWLDAVGRAIAQSLRHVGADHVRTRAGQTFANERPDVLDIPFDRIDIRPVLEPADEKHVASLRKRGTLRTQRVHIRNDTNICAGNQLAKHVALGVADDERDVGIPNRRKLRVANRARPDLRPGIGGDIGFALLAQEVQIHRIENDQCVRRAASNDGEQLRLPGDTGRPRQRRFPCRGRRAGAGCSTRRACRERRLPWP
jgi:hypothetical protein